MSNERSTGAAMNRIKLLSLNRETLMPLDPMVMIQVKGGRANSMGSVCPPRSNGCETATGGCPTITGNSDKCGPSKSDYQND
jgi:hypothetical protein